MSSVRPASTQRPEPRHVGYLCVVPDREPDGSRVVADRAAIHGIVQTFFAAFTSGPGSTAKLDALSALFLPEAVIVRTCGYEPVVYGVAGFIAPRRELLLSGTVTDFREWEVSGRTEVFGDIAQYLGSYAKRWVQDGRPHEGRGMKTLQLIRTSAGWRISGAAWDDEREGLRVEPSPLSTCPE